LKAQEVQSMDILLFATRPRLLFRLINITCAIFVSSYLLFNVLDLDGSRHSPTAAGGSQVFIDENVTDIKPISCPTLCELKSCSLSDDHSSHEVLASVLLARELRFSGLKASRRHRIALPRSSVADSSSPFQA
jgi:hypothetical protein